MTLRQLFADIPRRGEQPQPIEEATVTGLDYDSRRIARGNVFFAFPGAHADGRLFASQAMDRGAVAVVSESPRPADFAGPWIEVEHGRRALALAARAWFGPVEERIALTGITGTNGKTTTAYLVDSVLRAAGHTTAMIGTIEYRLAGEKLPAVNTTPESLDLYRMFEKLKSKGGTHVTMEVSSHGLALGRVWGLAFHTAIFTNLTRDHLDFHGDMENYFAAKRELFSGQDAPPPAAVINQDDPYGLRIEPPPGAKVYTYGMETGACVRADSISSTFEGLRFDILYGGARHRVESRLVGHINVYNILCAFCAGISHGIHPAVITRGIAACAAVPGRFERVEQGQPYLVIVDYAHTHDALRNTIHVARGLAPRRLLTLFGCGGDRDRTKRPLMGMAAGEGSDFVALTSDNPRSEDPISIMNDALVGLRRFDTPHIIEPDREKAIRGILLEAQPGDLVLLAGKGHETYQILRAGSIPFDDREVARRLLRGFGYGKSGE